MFKIWSALTFRHKYQQSKTDIVYVWKPATSSSKLDDTCVDNDLQTRQMFLHSWETSQVYGKISPCILTKMERNPKCQSDMDWLCSRIHATLKVSWRVLKGLWGVLLKSFKTFRTWGGEGGLRRWVLFSFYSPHTQTIIPHEPPTIDTYFSMTTHSQMLTIRFWQSATYVFLNFFTFRKCNWDSQRQHYPNLLTLIVTYTWQPILFGIFSYPGTPPIDCKSSLTCFLAFSSLACAFICWTSRESAFRLLMNRSWFPMHSWRIYLTQ